jgi:hypothetical protein
MVVDLWRWDKVWWRRRDLLVDALGLEMLGAASNGVGLRRVFPRYLGTSVPTYWAFLLES